MANDAAERAKAGAGAAAEEELAAAAVSLAAANRQKEEVLRMALDVDLDVQCKWVDDAGTAQVFYPDDTNPNLYPNPSPNPTLTGATRRRARGANRLGGHVGRARRSLLRVPSAGHGSPASTDVEYECGRCRARSVTS